MSVRPKNKIARVNRRELQPFGGGGAVGVMGVRRGGHSALIDRPGTKVED